MTESTAPSPDSGASPQRRTPVRAALLGLLALAALIAAVLIFGRGDDEAPAAGESVSASATPSSGASAASTSSAPTSGMPSASSATGGQPTTVPPTSTPPSSASPTDATSGQSEPPAPAGVVVLITSQSWNAQTSSIEVVGSVQGVATETSKCTATATMGGSSATATVEGTFDGQGTSCGLISIPMDGKPAGTYQVVISFDAGNGVAKSQPVNVSVP